MLARDRVDTPTGAGTVLGCHDSECHVVSAAEPLSTPMTQTCSVAPFLHEWVCHLVHAEDCCTSLLVLMLWGFGGVIGERNLRPFMDGEFWCHRLYGSLGMCYVRSSVVWYGMVFLSLVEL